MFNRKSEFLSTPGFQPLPPFKTLCCVYVCDILFLSIFCVNVLRIDLLLKFVFEHFQFPDLRL